jgi:hypothetical protein
MSQPKSFDVERKFERRMDFIFTGRCDDDLTLAIEEDQQRAEAVSDDFLSLKPGN